MSKIAMGAISKSSFCAGIGLVLLAGTTSACDSGVVRLELLTAVGADGGAGGSETPPASTQEAGRGGSGGASGHHAEPRGGSSAPSFEPSCEAHVEPEAALLEALNHAISSGAFCPKDPPGLRRRLVVDDVLRDWARGRLCSLIPGGPVWASAPRSSLWAWSLWDTPSLEDAKTALLEGDRDALCEAAERSSFKIVGIGQVGDNWSVMIAEPFQDPQVPQDPPPDNMQKP